MFLFFCQPTSNAIKASMWIEKKIIIWCQILFYGVPVSVITYVSRDGSIPLFQNRYNPIPNILSICRYRYRSDTAQLF